MAIPARVIATLVAFVVGAGCGGGEPVDPAVVARSTLRQVVVGSHTFDVRMAGPEDGDVVILLHGFPQTSYEWRHQLTALGSAGYRAVAPDQRGYSPGARPAEVSAYAAQTLVDDVLGLADAIGAERFHLVGHDWGAAVTWGVAAVAPDRVITANPISVPHLDAFAKVLGDTTSCQVEASSYFDLFIQPDSEDQFLVAGGMPLRALFAELDGEAVDEYLRVLGSKEALGAALNWYRANISDRSLNTPAIGAITVPTMFIWSDGDTALCIDGALLTEDYVAGPYRFEVIEGVSHWVPDLAPETLTALLLDHLEQHPAR